MQRMRAWRGPALFSYGFRPFFLLAGCYAAAVILVWIMVLWGDLRSPGNWPPLAWHSHELIFGFVPAVMAGFLLTAVPNWTGRLPVIGWPLAALVSAWIAGRAAVAVAGFVPALAVSVVTIAFPLVLFAVLGREVLRGRNWHNLPVILAVLMLTLAQALFHAELRDGGTPVRGDRLGIAVEIFLISLIGGRIIPSFTTSWLKRRAATALPMPFRRFDAVTVASAAVALTLWAILPLPPSLTVAVGIALLATGALHLRRQARWQPLQTGSEALVWVLHLAYLFVPIGFFLTGLGVLLDSHGSEMAGLHAWAVGGIGLMTLAVMTRATRGHTGRCLSAPPATAALYLAVAFAAVARIAASLVPAWSLSLLLVAAIGWSAGFVGFVALYGPMLILPRERAASAGEGHS